MLCEIGFQQIRDSFHYGYYGQFKVVVDKTDGYINATKLCSDGGKKFCHWSETKISKELLNTLQQFNFTQSINCDEETQEPWSIGYYLPVSQVTKYVHTFNLSDEDKAISGTYVHPLIIPHIACWVSPMFALKAASIINFFIVEEWKAKLDASERSAAQFLATIHQQQLAIEDAQQSANTAQQALQHAEERVNDVVNVKKEVIGNLDDKLCTKIREKQIWSTTHSFSLIKLNDENSQRPFYVIRCQGRRMNAAIKKLRRKHPAAEVLFLHRKIPNAVNLYTRLKTQKVVKSTHNYCTPTCDEQQLLFHLSSLCGTDYPTSNTAPLNNNRVLIEENSQ
jgi:KilA-N domain/Protein of unknown function (DUF3627)